MTSSACSANDPLYLSELVPGSDHPTQSLMSFSLIAVPHRIGLVFRNRRSCFARRTISASSILRGRHLAIQSAEEPWETGLAMARKAGDSLARTFGECTAGS